MCLSSPQADGEYLLIVLQGQDALIWFFFWGKVVCLHHLIHAGTEIWRFVLTVKACLFESCIMTAMLEMSLGIGRCRE